MTIDYKNPYNTGRNVSQLIEFLMWTTCVAGKNSATITPRFNDLIEDQREYNIKRDIFEHPAMTVIRSHGNRIRSLLKRFGIGQYTKLIQCWQTIHNGSVEAEYENSKLNHEIKIKSGKFLEKAPRDYFLKIPGIGLKTASFFILNTRAWEEIAVLDVHILKHLKQKFPRYDIPQQTPQNKDVYLELEAMFLGLACQANMSAREYDLMLWKELSNNQ